MIITPLRIQDGLKVLSDYFKAVRPRPYDFLPSLSEATLAGFLQRRLESLGREGGQVLLARTESGPAGLLVWRPLVFDSNLFGHVVGRLDHLSALGDAPAQLRLFSSLLACAEESWRRADISLVYAKLRIEELAAQWALTRQGFGCMGGWINYGLWLERWECPRLPAPASLRPASRLDARILENLAAESFTLDRFHADPRISSTRADQLHRYWIRNSITGEAAQAVLVAENDLGQVVGFLSYNLRDEEPDRLGGLRVARVILNAVSARERGKGIYSQMLSNAILECQGQADYLQVETQLDNYTVQRSWNRLGLFPAESGLNLHYWLRPQAREG